MSHLFTFLYDEVVPVLRSLALITGPNKNVRERKVDHLALMAIYSTTQTFAEKHRYQSAHLNCVCQWLGTYGSRARCDSFQDCIWLPGSQKVADFIQSIAKQWIPFQSYRLCRLRISYRFTNIGQVSVESDNFCALMTPKSNCMALVEVHFKHEAFMALSAKKVPDPQYMHCFWRIVLLIPSLENPSMDWSFL